MHRHIRARVFQLASSTVLVLSFVGASSGQESQHGSRTSRDLATLEDQVFSEINLLRSDPNDYAERFIAPLKERLVRLPRNADQPFLQFRAFLIGGTKIDYLTLDEGGTEETARAILDEAIEALRAAPKLARLQRNDVLDRSARFYSHDFLVGGKRRDPHVDSLGRKAGARIGSFGGSRSSIADWQRFVNQLPDNGTDVARVFKKEGRYYWVAYSGSNAYRYWSVPDDVGEFVAQHGEEATLARLKEPGYECSITVDRKTKTLHHGDAQVRYPFLLPIHGENVTWGNWSQSVAARGMICWWLLDPGIQERGHRKMLLDPDYKVAGVGCARSRSVGWVTTLDACAEELVELPAE
ncbi:MAG: hypothetical protein QF918_11475 [Pirellulaceae bacterium]|jgi:hypothetical protein|nr:hypothetical protein [Pirellulaceae bacterium]